MTSVNEKEEVTLKSVFASATITILKLIIGLVTGSIGILSEAAHSAIDLVATIITFFAVRIGDKPADKKHHFGHGKIESVSALVETGLLFATSGLVIYEASKKIILGSHSVEIAWYSFAVMAISIIVDLVRSNALERVARETGSQAMKADALNFRADMFSSSIVILGLFLALLGLPIADAIASIGVSIFIILAAWRMLRQTVDILVDTAPEGIEEKIIEITKKIPEVIDVVQVRVRLVGNTIFTDMTIHISRKHPLSKVKEVKENILEKIEKSIPGIDLSLNVVPLNMDDETIVDQIRITGNNLSLAVHDISIHNHNQKRYISFDVEVDSKTPLGKAHKEVHRLEEILKKEIGGETEITAHIEPQYDEREIVEKPTQVESEKAEKAIKNAAMKIKSLTGVHDINITKHNKKLHITLHCYADENMPLEQVHRATSQLDKSIRQIYPLVERVTIHTEPKEK